MPLYEFIIIAKATTSQNSVNLLHDIVRTVLTRHPSVKIRDVQNLGDRIMGNSLNVNKVNYHIGRYLQILLDAPPSVNLTVREVIRDRYKSEVFRSYMHRIDDLDYALNMYFRAGRAIDPFTDVKDYEYAQKVMEMKEKIDNYE